MLLNSCVGGHVHYETATGHFGYRKAKHLIEEAMADRLIELEDIELILAGKRYRKNAGNEKAEVRE
ncbi:MAG: hypothetical protein JXA57_08330 [Armatimonadetes bacterium]|nr:hypothetical protein [Armatimonadota bacterium]